MEIVDIATAELREYENNPRKNDDAVKYVAASIQEFGFKVPIVIDADKTIICGHTRLKAARKLKLKTVPCIYADDLTPEQVRAYRLADNKTAEQSEWDADKLAVEMASIELDLSQFGFANIDLTDSVEEVETPEPQENTDTIYGDIFHLGRHRLMCGDATKTTDMEKLMNGATADMVFTEPPEDENDPEEYLAFLTAALDNAYQSTKSGGGIYIPHNDDKGLDIRRAMTETGWLSKQTIVWIKSNPQDIHRDYAVIHTPILYGWKPGEAHAFYGDRKQTTTWHMEEEAGGIPIALCAKAIANSTEKGGTVIDPFGGKGSTLMAADQMGRICYVMESDPRYCDTIIKRWEQYTGQKSVRLRGENNGN